MYFSNTYNIINLNYNIIKGEKFMNKTIALSAILVSLSILFIGTMLMVSNPDVDEGTLYYLSGFILIISVPSFIVALYKLIKYVWSKAFEKYGIKKNT